MPQPPAISPRKLACARCGTAFDCGLSGDCWCAAEPYRLPVPDPAGSKDPDAPADCLCPACLRQTAAQKAAAQKAATPS